MREKCSAKENFGDMRAADDVHEVHHPYLSITRCTQDRGIFFKNNPTDF